MEQPASGNISLLFPNEVVIPKLISWIPDDYKVFQDLLWKVAATHKIPTEKVQERLYKLLHFLHTLVVNQLANLINKQLLDLDLIVK